MTYIFPQYMIKFSYTEEIKMQEVIFVTHNKGKIASAKKQLKDVDFKVFEYDLE